MVRSPSSLSNILKSMIYLFCAGSTSLMRLFPQPTKRLLVPSALLVSVQEAKAPTVPLVVTVVIVASTGRKRRVHLVNLGRNFLALVGVPPEESKCIVARLLSIIITFYIRVAMLRSTTALSSCWPPNIWYVVCL